MLWSFQILVDVRYYIESLRLRWLPVGGIWLVKPLMSRLYWLVQLWSTMHIRGNLFIRHTWLVQILIITSHFIYLSRCFACSSDCFLAHMLLFLSAYSLCTFYLSRSWFYLENLSLSISLLWIQFQSWFYYLNSDTNTNVYSFIADKIR